MNNLRYISIIVLLVACSSSSVEDTHSFQIYEENGIEVAETTGGPKYDEELFQYELILELKEDERDESLLYRPDDFWMDGAGQFYVCDARNFRIAVFDQSGRYLYSMGREGGGPGDFSQNFQISEIREDTLIVSDRSQHRFTLFRTDGTLLDVIAARHPTPFALRVYWIGFNKFLTLGRDQTSRRIDPAQMRTFAIMHDAGGDTIWYAMTPRIDTHHRIPDSNSMMAYPLGSFPAYAYKPGWGIVVTTGEDPSLEVWNLDGLLNRKIKIDLPIIETTNEDYEVEIAYYREQLELYGDIPAARRNIEPRLNNVQLKRTRAHWRSIDIDDAFFIWLETPEHRLHQQEAGGGILYKVLSPEGEFLGQSRRPRGQPTRLFNGYLLSMDFDPEQGAARLLVYRIRPAVDGLKYP